MTATELKEKDNDVLQQELIAQTKHLFDLRSQAVTEKLEDPSQIGKTRKTIARIKTIIRQRELESAKKETASK
jgi:large subunit ribosomal protein L29